MRMKTNRNFSRKRKVLAILSVVMILLFVVFAESYIIQDLQKRTPPKTLDIKIYPKDIDLLVGQVKTFYLLVSNGTPPYETKWYSNGTFLGVGQQINYTFQESAKYAILSVNTLDSSGNYGYDSAYVFNPTNMNTSLADIPSQAYFTIKTDGTNCWAVRYDGYKAYDGTVASTVINDALSGLTPGRTWKERVALFGNFTITRQITPSSYTILDLSQANLITTNETLKVIYIEGGSFANAKIHIDIVGGHIYGAGTTGGVSGGAIYAEYTNYTSIEDVTATHFCGIGTTGNYGEVIWTGRGYYNVIQGCRIIDCRGYNSLSFYDQYYSLMTDNYIDGGANKASLGSPQGGSGIYCGDSSTANAGQGNKILNNVVTNWGGYDANHGYGHAIYIGVLTKDVLVEGNDCFQPDPPPNNAQQAVTLKGRGIVFTHNFIHDLRGVCHGVTVCPESPSAGTADDITVEGNVFRNITSKYSFYFVEGGLTPIYRTKVFANKFEDFYIGIQFACSSAGVSRFAMIEYNDFSNGTYGINFSSNYEDCTLIAYNSFASVGTIFPSAIGGNRTTVKENDGYITEASGTATNKVDEDMISTGLVANIAWLMVACNRTGVICTATFSGTTITLDMRWENGTAVAQGTTVYWEARTWNYP